MPHSKTIRRLENLHIPLWLLKDTCWMLVWRPLGVTMIFPTVTVAIIIAWKTRKTVDSYMNLAICAWILANSYWMCSEFFHFEEIKEYALVPFIVGIILCAIFFVKKRHNDDGISFTE